MANKFTQSILERQYKEAQEEKHAKKTAVAKSVALEQETPAKTIIQPEEQGAALIAEPVKVKEFTPVEKLHTEPISSAAIELNLDAYIIKSNDRIAKNKTFYLDQNVIEGIKSAAKRQKVTDSKLVNDILKKVLSI